MRQVVQSVSNGHLRVVDVPQPEAGPTEVLVATRRSLLSAGTERAVTRLASANLVQKARARPDLVRQVVSRARTNGIRSTVQAVRTRLDDEMALGYSAAGIALTVGEHVAGLKPGMRVATASAGHAEYQVVPGLLTVPLPDSVSDEEAAFGAVGAIALQGLRQADVGLGGTICVIGLGLVGQLTVRLALAAGLTVIGIDLREWTAQLATDHGGLGLVEAGQATTDAVRDHTRGRGVDAVLITAATPSSEPAMRATALTRDRGRLVIVGDVGLDLNRRPFYEKELEVRFARSYGPGRYERSYEDWGIDLPIGHVRWTEARNIEAYVELVAQRRLDVSDLVTHVFDIEQAADAYATMLSDVPSLAIQLAYDAPTTHQDHPVVLATRRSTPRPRLGLIGSGNFARATFLPALRAAGWEDSLHSVTSSKVVSARRLAERHHIGHVQPTAETLIAQPEVDAVCILSRHDSHAEITVDALNANKHVFVEKPLALTEQELEKVLAAHATSTGQLFVGFNRRYSPAVQHVERVMSQGTGPISLSYRINAGELPATHWYKDRRQGGRIMGEVCHFIDLCNWLVKQPPQSVSAFGAGTSELVLNEDVAILMAYPDGSTACINYSTGGHPGTPKEHLEIMGRGQTIALTDFQNLTVNGKRVKGVSSGKGHQEELRRFLQIVTGERQNDDDLQASISTTRTVLQVIRTLCDRRAAS